MSASPRQPLGALSPNARAPPSTTKASELDTLRKQLAKLKNTQLSAKRPQQPPAAEKPRAPDPADAAAALHDFAEVESQLAQSEQPAAPPAPPPPAAPSPPREVESAVETSELEQQVKAHSKQAAATSKSLAKDLAKAQKKMRAEVASERRKLGSGKASARRASISGPATPGKGKLRAEVDTLRTQAKTWLGEKESFRAEVEGMDKQIKQLRSALTKAEAKTKTAVQQKLKAQQELKAQQKVCREHERKVREISHEAGKAKEAQASDGTVYIRMQAQQRKMQEYEQERDEAELKQEELRVESEIARSSLQAEQERHAAAAEDLRDVQAQLEDTKARLSAAENAAATSEANAAQVTQLTERLQVTERARLEIRDEMQSWRQRCQDGQGQLLVCKEALSDAERSQQTLLVERADSEAALEQLREEAQQLRLQRRKAEEAAEGAVSGLEAAQKELATVMARQHAAAAIQAAWSTYRCRCVLQRMRLGFSRALSSAVQQKQTECEATVVELESKLEVLTADSETMASELQEKTATIRALMDDVAAARRSAASIASGKEESERKLTQRCEQLEADARAVRAAAEADSTLRADEVRRSPLVVYPTRS